jgi:hypothetical protein
MDQLEQVVKDMIMQKVAVIRFLCNNEKSIMVFDDSDYILIINYKKE